MSRIRLSRRPAHARREREPGKRSALDILVIARCPAWPLDLGDRLILYHVTRDLEQRGHCMDLLAFYQRARDLADVPFYDRAFRIVHLVREPARPAWKYLVRRYRPQRRFPARAERAWSPEMWRAVQERLRLSSYDVVFLFGGVATYEYFRLVHNTPNVIAAYESYTLLLERAVRHAPGFAARWAAKLQFNMARNYESWMFTGFDRVVALAAPDADALRALDPSLRVAVISNGVDPDYFAPTMEDPGEPVLLFTGNFGYAPNVDAARVLIDDVMPRVCAQIPDAHLMLVGVDPPPSLQAAQCAYVTVTGRVPDMRPYFERASVYVSPLRVGAGVKNKVLEAMAMAKPVIATPLSCDGLDITSGQNVILAQDAPAIAEEAVRVLRDRDLRRRLAQGARALVRSRYTWRQTAERYESLFYQVVEERRLGGG